MPKYIHHGQGGSHRDSQVKQFFLLAVISYLNLKMKYAPKLPLMWRGPVEASCVPNSLNSTACKSKVSSKGF